jgi:hypothetical protein
MENNLGRIKADNIFGEIIHSKEKQIVSLDEAIHLPNESMKNLKEADDNKSKEDFEETNMYYNS